MNTSALIIMVPTLIGISGFTVYFFWKVLNVPKRDEPDSFSDN
ncbi:MAG: hypothetical protein SFW35_11415 [Chitinophagales bacterium]|nr:hypothetical protein [Chitinophagales bacterium]